MVRAVSDLISRITSLWQDLSDKAARDEYVAARIETDLSHQIYALREQNGWTQEELAQRCGYENSQSRISKLENSCEGVSVNTLLRLASAFDVGLSIKFVPHSELGRESVVERLDRVVPAYPDDSPLIGVISASTPTPRAMGSIRASGRNGSRPWTNQAIPTPRITIRETVNG